MRPGELVVHCSVHDAAGALVERMLVRAAQDAPASVVLARVLRLTLAEQRRGRSLTVDGPPEVLVLLAVAGLGSPDGIRP